MEKFSIWIAEILILNKASDKIQFILISNDPNFELFFFSFLLCDAGKNHRVLH